MLQEEVDKDVKIKSDHLDIESLRIPELHNKYLKYYNRFQLLLKKTETDYKELYKEKWEYYTGKLDEDSITELGLEPFPLKILKTVS